MLTGTCEEKDARHCPDTEEAAMEDISVDWKLRGTEKSLNPDEELANELFDMYDSIVVMGDLVFCQLYDAKSLSFPEHELSEMILIGLPMLEELLQKQSGHNQSS